MKKIIAIVVLAGSSSAALADIEYGIGVSLQNSDGVIQMPINLSESWRIEPSLGYSRYESKSDLTSSDGRFLELDIGIYKKVIVAPRVNFLYGAKVGYIKSEFNYDSGDHTDSNKDGYSLAPTLGLEYQMMDHLYVGGEIGLKYYDIDGSQESFANDQDTSEKGTRTQTGINVRYFY